MDRQLKILHLEDNIADAEFTRHALVKGKIPHEIKVVESRNGFIDALATYAPDLILSDHSLPGFDSMEAFEIMNAKLPGTPFILVTGSVSEEFAVDSLKAGVDDYILKKNIIRLPSAIEKLFSKKQIQQEKEVIENLHTQLQVAYRQIEAKNREITDSINYAQKVQQATLPPIGFIRQFLPGSFVLYKPKDIVAGDFYWFDKHHEKVFFAAADCTGHGVPGALLSMVCGNALKSIVHELNIYDTGKILDKTRDLVLDTFAKAENDVKDGMDISLCSINTKTGEVWWSGANNPLWYIQNNELKEIKPHKQCIGKTDAPTSFPTHYLQLKSNDSLYLITDGFADQFGGPSGKKYKQKQLQQMLMQTNQYDLERQREILDKSFEDWKGDLEQVDDVTIVGIRF